MKENNKLNLLKELLAENKKLKQEIEELKKDNLTKLPLRKALQENFEKNEYNYIAMIDIDNFKKINDTLGHQQGDEALKLLAKKLIFLASTHDFFVERHGGEEFIILSKICDEENFINILENFRIEIENTLSKEFKTKIEEEKRKSSSENDEKIKQNLSIIGQSDNKSLKFEALETILQCLKENIDVTIGTISIGIAKIKNNLAETLEDVDNALYVAKGKNQTTKYEIPQMGNKNVIAILKNNSIKLYKGQTKKLTIS